MACCAFERDVYYWSSAKGQLYISAIIIIHSTNCRSLRGIMPERDDGEHKFMSEMDSNFSCLKYL